MSKDSHINYKKDALLNTIGNFAYLGALWLMSVLVVRISGFDDAGYFSLAMTTANIYISLASYTVRLYYAADLNYRFSDNQYILMRILTTASSFVLCFGCSLVAGYTGKKLIVILLFYIFKCAEMMSDILFGMLQRKGKLYLSGYTMTFKSVISLVAFCLILKITQNLVIALAVMAVIAILVFLFIDYPIAKKYATQPIKLTKKDFMPALKLCKICFSLFIVGLCFNVIPSLPRLVFEKIYSTEALGYYSSISTITVLISTAVNCVLIPLVPKFTTFYQENQKKKMTVLTFGCIGIILAIGVICFIGSLIAGKWILTLLFGQDIAPYVYIFKWVIVATILQSVIICFNDFFVAVERQNILMYGSIIGLILCIALSYPLCKKYYMYGVTNALIISQGIEIAFFIFFIVKIIRNMDKPCIGKEDK